VLVADPPLAIVPGESEGWGALLARQAPGAASTPALHEPDGNPGGRPSEGDRDGGHPR